MKLQTLKSPQYMNSKAAALVVVALVSLFDLVITYGKLARFNFDPRSFADIDGAFVYSFAQSLPSLHTSLDAPAYRAQRILLSMLAAPFGPYIPWALILVNMVALAVGTYTLARIAQHYRMPALVGAIFGLWVGSLFALEFNLTEVLTYALVAGGIWAWERQKPLVAAGLFGVAVLAKETAILYGIAFLLAQTSLSRPARGFFALLAFGPALLWQVVLIATFGESGIIAAFHPGSPADHMFPLVGLWQAQMHAPGAWIIQIGWVLIPSAVAVGWGAFRLWRQDRSPIAWALLLNGLFVLSLPAPSTEYMVHSARIALAVVVAITWGLIRAQRPQLALLWLVLMLGPSLTLQGGFYF